MLLDEPFKLLLRFSSCGSRGYFAGDIIEQRRQIGSYRTCGGSDCNGDDTCNQAIFDCRDALVVSQEFAGEMLHFGDPRFF